MRESAGQRMQGDVSKDGGEEGSATAGPGDRAKRLGGAGEGAGEGRRLVSRLGERDGEGRDAKDA